MYVKRVTKQIDIKIKQISLNISLNHPFQVPRGGSTSSKTNKLGLQAYIKTLVMSYKYGPLFSLSLGFSWRIIWSVLRLLLLFPPPSSLLSLLPLGLYFPSSIWLETFGLFIFGFDCTDLIIKITKSIKVKSKEVWRNGKRDERVFET